jgi:hypothetical protein
MLALGVAIVTGGLAYGYAAQLRDARLKVDSACVFTSEQNTPACKYARAELQTVADQTPTLFR